jgi:hypothetical protein
MFANVPFRSRALFHTRARGVRSCAAPDRRICPDACGRRKPWMTQVTAKVNTLVADGGAIMSDAATTGR